MKRHLDHPHRRSGVRSCPPFPLAPAQIARRRACRWRPSSPVRSSCCRRRAGPAGVAAPRGGAGRQARLPRAASARRSSTRALPDFRDDTRDPRGDWTVAPIPAALQDRRVEITGPTDPKMVINALNSGAKVFMADFEDSTSPTWRNLLAGQRRWRRGARRPRITAANGKHYALRPFESRRC
jgi:hypothetical protein